MTTGPAHGFERLASGDAVRRRDLAARLDRVARFSRPGRRDEVAAAIIAAFPETSAMLRLVRAMDAAGGLVTPEWRRIPLRPGVIDAPVGATVAEVVDDEVEAMIAELHVEDDHSHRRTGQNAVLRLCREAVARTSRRVDANLVRPDGPVGEAPLGELDRALDACPNSAPENELRTRVLAVLDPTADAARRAELSPVVDAILTGLSELRLGTELRERATRTRRDVAARWDERATTGVGPDEARWRVAVADHLRDIEHGIPALDTPSADPPFAAGYTSTRAVARRALAERASTFASLA